MKSQDPSRNYGVDPIFARTIRQLFWWVKFAESLLLTSDRMASSRVGRLLGIFKRYRDRRQFPRAITWDASLTVSRDLASDRGIKVAICANLLISFAPAVMAKLLC